MSTVQKFAVGLISIGLVTAVLLPGRNTVGVLNAGQQLISGSLHTAITGST